ncbi:amidohydrolase family protein [Streptomyces bottropensis]|uniref:amidohydrolase family protein n=1 Tax=Streptomyces bottropensis TaxID=42235 RepID=UPI0037F8071D
MGVTAVGRELARLRRGFTLADEPEARAAGVTATVLVRAIDVPEETPEFLTLARDSALVAGVVGWTDLASPDVARALAALREGPGREYLVGIRHQVRGECDPRRLVRPDTLRELAAVAAAGLAYDMVLKARRPCGPQGDGPRARRRRPYGPEKDGAQRLLLRGAGNCARPAPTGVRPHRLAAAQEAAQLLPGLTFVLDHLGKPSSPRACFGHGRTPRACRPRRPTPSASSPAW